MTETVVVALAAGSGVTQAEAEAALQQLLYTKTTKQLRTLNARVEVLGSLIGGVLFDREYVLDGTHLLAELDAAIVALNQERNVLEPLLDTYDRLAESAGGTPSVLESEG
jgi:hypothetical protein